MDFQGFTTLMQAMDVRERKAVPGYSSEMPMYANDLTQIDATTFSYCYDSLVTSVLRFEEDGSVTVWPDVDPDRYTETTPDTYPSFDAWADEMIAIFVEFAA